MKATFAIDALPERAGYYARSHAIVAVDVYRATTTIVTALVAGRAVYPVATVAEARRLAARLKGAVLMGEQGGIRPRGFHLNNTPAGIARLAAPGPVVLVTSAGTVLLASCRGAPAIYAACLRNLSATAQELARRHNRVALIGAGTRGEPRAEDQMACALIGRSLQQHGFVAEDGATAAELRRWPRLDPQVLRAGPSADYLRGSEQQEDVDYIVAHVDDVAGVAVFDGHQLALRPVGSAAATTEAAPVA